MYTIRFNNPDVFSKVGTFVYPTPDPRIQNPATGQRLNIKNPNTSPFIPTVDWLYKQDTQCLLPPVWDRTDGQITYEAPLSILQPFTEPNFPKLEEELHPNLQRYNLDTYKDPMGVVTPNFRWKGYSPILGNEDDTFYTNPDISNVTRQRINITASQKRPILESQFFLN